ncbi:MAG: phosphoribosylanthranilate isomerase [Acidimicrobiia bacterium]
MLQQPARVRCKICCISSTDEVALATAHGADALGLVGAMPSGPGVLEDAQIAMLASNVPPAVASFLLTSETSPDKIVEHVRRVGVSTVQLVDWVGVDAYSYLRERLGAVRIVQALHVEDDGALTQAHAVAPLVDALLLDSGRPNAPVRELGGTGRAHDWSISAEIVRTVDCPVFLAGGLHAENVGAAVAEVRPYAVDVCSGVRADGQLDATRLRAFMDALRTPIKC